MQASDSRFGSLRLGRIKLHFPLVDARDRGSLLIGSKQGGRFNSEIFEASLVLRETGWEISFRISTLFFDSDVRKRGEFKDTEIEIVDNPRPRHFYRRYVNGSLTQAKLVPLFFYCHILMYTENYGICNKKKVI